MLVYLKSFTDREALNFIQTVKVSTFYKMIDKFCELVMFTRMLINYMS